MIGLALRLPTHNQVFSTLGAFLGGQGAINSLAFQLFSISASLLNQGQQQTTSIDGRALAIGINHNSNDNSNDGA